MEEVVIRRLSWFEVTLTDGWCWCFWINDRAYWIACTLLCSHHRDPSFGLRRVCRICYIWDATRKRGHPAGIMMFRGPLRERNSHSLGGICSPQQATLGDRLSCRHTSTSMGSLLLLCQAGTEINSSLFVPTHPKYVCRLNTTQTSGSSRFLGLCREIG